MGDHQTIGRVVKVLLFVFSFSFVSGAEASQFLHNLTLPSTLTVRAGVITDTRPLAWTTEESSDDDVVEGIPFPNYQGFMPNLMREMVRIAREKDNVALHFELEELPPVSYTAQFERMASDCNQSTAISPLPWLGLDSHKNQPEYWSDEECNRYDMIVGDFYPVPERTLRGVMSPTFASTSAATVRSFTSGCI